MCIKEPEHQATLPMSPKYPAVPHPSQLTYHNSCALCLLG